MPAEIQTTTPPDPKSGNDGKGMVVSVQAVSKAYRIWETPAARLTSPLQESLAGFLPGPAGAALRRRATRQYRDFYALRGVALELRRGESVGIIGRNGSGKSTLLQIIAGTLQPSAGSVQVNGRVAALLELGSGFNPEFTGRENIRLNALVLGLDERTVNERMDSIIAYADIGEFIDQSVRTYSSGMAMRLAFAVAAHVDADILIIDEALGVGDARFQLKCARTIDGFMESGKTLVFVSHDFSSVKRLCRRVLLLEQGRLIMDDEPNRVVNHYLKLLTEGDKASPASVQPGSRATSPSPSSTVPSPAAPDDRLAAAHAALARLAAEPPLLQQLQLVAESDRQIPDGAGDKEFSYGGEMGRIENLRLSDQAGNESRAFLTGESATISFEAHAVEDILGSVYAVTIKNTLGQDVYVTNTLYKGLAVPDLPSGRKHRVTFHLQLNLMPGEYFVSLGWVIPVSDQLIVVQRRYDALKVSILPVDRRIGIANLHSEIEVVTLT